MRRRKRRESWQKTAAGIFLALLMVSAMVLFRYYATVTRENARTASSAEPTAEPATVSLSPIPETNEAEPTPDVSPVPQATEAPVVEELSGEKVYTSETYDLVSELVYAYRYQPEGYAEVIQRDIEKLKEVNASLGRAWEGIMNYWDYVNTGLEINSGVLPDGLPEDDSLCMVVLGFQLLDDGSMAPELIGRCETALASAQKYPNAYIAVTGGVTSEKNKEISEGKSMADWLIEHGISEDRIIMEEESQTTAENAEFTGKILMEQYPQIKSVAIITSDYHIPLSSLMFEEEALLAEWQTGTKPFTVISNAAYATPGRVDYEGTTKQAIYMWALAAPEY